jgi:YhcH/YjgK/YiaL family protein
MILDVKKNAPLYKGIHGNLDKAINYMLSADLNALPVGKHLIEGEDVFVLIQEYETKSMDSSLFEAHQKYMDIQLILSGEEWIGYAPVQSLTSIEPYDDTKDIAFFIGEGEMHKLKRDTFSIYFPTDAHKPSIHDVKTDVKKAVFKIKF